MEEMCRYNVNLYFLAICIIVVTANLNVEYQYPCSSGKFFDISSLNCSDCAQGFPSSNQLYCITCDTTTGSAYYFTSDGYSATQNWANAKETSSDTCICSASSSSTVIAQVDNGGLFEDRCVVCPSNTSASSTTQQCVNSGYPSTTSSSELSSIISILNSQGAGITASSATTAAFSLTAASGSTFTLSVQQSEPLVLLLGPAATQCYYGKNRAACNAVANLCVLELYNQAAAACQIYNELVTLNNGRSTTSTATRPSTAPLPWLFYGGSTFLTATDLNLRVQFYAGDLANATASDLQIVLSTYYLNGTWLGLRNFTSQFQICGASKFESSSWLRFGWDYINNCNLKLDEILAELGDSDQPLLFDPFLMDGENVLYPIPIVISNIQPTSSAVTTVTGVRRFFYVEDKLGTPLNGVPTVVQYPSSFALTVTLRQDPRDSIYPPALYITYAAQDILTADYSVTRPISFEVTYINEANLDGKFWKAWQTILIVFEICLSLPYFVWRMYLFMKSNRSSDQSEQSLLIYLLITICDCGSSGLVMVLMTVTMYYLILYKEQQEVQFLMLMNDQLGNFQNTLIIAIVGQTVGLLWMLYQQCLKLDVFFIDWEKPRRVLSGNQAATVETPAQNPSIRQLTGSNRTGAREDKLEEDAPVSCWRTLMIANEWNKLQSKRVTSPAFTMIMMVFIMEGANVIISGAIIPVAKDFQQYLNIYESTILRFGIEATFLFVLLLGQYVLKKMIYYHYIADPVIQFVDLTFLANISIVVLDNAHSGYYIHGRNKSTHSDSHLPDVNFQLVKEREGLQPRRGLVTTYENARHLNDNQTFLLYITESQRRAYNSLLQSQSSLPSVGKILKGSGPASPSMLEKRDEVAKVFREMVLEVESKHATQVLVPALWQSILQLRPTTASADALMIHDYFHSFSSVLFFGQELRLYAYEALFFCAVDMSLQNVAQTAIITYLVTMVLNYVRKMLGATTLSRTTLVDRHFLL